MKNITVALLLTLGFAPAGRVSAEDARKDHAMLINIMDGKNAAQAPQAVPVDAEISSTLNLLLTSAPKLTLAPALLPTLNSYQETDKAATVVCGSAVLVGLIGATVGWITAGAVGAWAGLGIGLAAGLLLAYLVILIRG